jgi:hypothetical protein
MNPNHAHPAHTSPPELAHVVKTPLSNTSDVLKIEFPVVRYAVPSSHAGSIHAINHVINLENVSHVLKHVINQKGSVDIHVPPNVTLRPDVPRMILASTWSYRLVHVETFNPGHHAEQVYRVNRGNRRS